MKKKMPKAYNPREVEDKIYKKWEGSGYFNPDNLELPDKTKKFSIAMPPPNATGVLHLGHASMLAYQDLMIRYNRMKGKKTLWLPGTDHAAIATQAKLEKIIAKEGKTKYDLGREKFIKRVEEYIENSRNVIKNQTRKMGSSCDWSRERYTLDKGLSRAVREVFVKMYNDGLIYRGDRIVNWCPRCESTLADDEVEYKEEKIPFYYFKYGPIIVGTARPETKFADKIIVVHPNDKRYKNLIGKTFIVPWIEGDVEARVIADKSVDKDFGTGAMTITPAHSFEDFQLAQKLGIEIVKIIDEKGNLTKFAGSFAGMNANKARGEIVEKMKQKGLADHIDENYIHNLSICYRCDTPVEPLPSLQWFIDVDKKITIKGNKYFQNKSLKDIALEVVKNKEIKIIPERFEKTYFNWMENLHDWCISRQIWFGHRIPVWYKFKVQSSKFKVAVQDSKTEEEIYVGVEPPEEKSNFVFLHSYKASADDDFWLWLKDKMISHNVFLPNLPNPSEPNLKEQIDYVLNNTEINESTIIVGHSLGAVLAMKLISEKNLKIKKLILVAPPLQAKKFVDGQKRPSLEKYCDWKFDFKKIKKLVQDVVVFRDICDPIVFANEPRKIAEELSAKLVEVKAPGSHFNCEKCDEILKETQNLFWTQDEDTLDTWFSSGLWTFSTLLNQNHEKYKTFEDWIAGSPDLKNFHPTSVMETGYDIIFFWVARMILMTTYVIGEIPFENVYLHGMVRDKQGRKMSKSLGNGIDPVEMIEKYGTDALRLSMIVGSSPGNDIKLYEEKIEGYRNFVNKLWNISRYIIQNQKPKTKNQKLGNWEIDRENLTLADKWILEHLENLKYVVNNAIENYQFSYAIDSDDGIRAFMWDKFADWYLEISKIQGRNDAVLIYVLETLLKLCHPFIPFVTEQIWQEMGKEKLLMIEEWPESGEYKPTQINMNFYTLQNIISGIRKIKKDNGIALKEKVEVIVNTDVLLNIAGMSDEDKDKDETIKIIKDLNKEAVKTIEENRDIIEKLAGAKNLKIVGDIEKPKGWTESYSTVLYYVNVGDSINKEKEAEKTQKEIKNLEKHISQINIKLSNRQFVANAPKEIVNKEKEKLKESEEKLGRLEEKLKSLLQF